MRLSSTLLAFALPFLAAAQGAPNDDCATAFPIACGDEVSGSTADAFPDEAFECGTSITAPGVWYVLQGSNAQVTVATCTANSYDTKLNVYRGTCGTIFCVGGNDDSPGCGLGSRVTFSAIEGDTYYVLVQGYNNAVGAFTLTVECAPFTIDDCGGAQPIACGQALAGSTAGATPDAPPACGTSYSAPGVWYTVTGINGTATATTCPDPAYDTKLNVFSGSCNTLVCVGGNDDTPNVGLCSTVQWEADPTLTYYILVQGYDGQIGDFTLSLNCTNCPPAQNLSVAPLDVSATVNWTSTNSGAQFTLEYGPAGFAPGSGTVINGQNGVDGPPVTIGGLELGTDYQVYLTETCTGETSPVVGPVSFTTSSIVIAPNALCSGALPISCGNGVLGNTTEGVFTAGPACGAANITTKGLWYSFTGSDGLVTLSTCGLANFDTKISVFSGGCNDLTCVAGNDDAPGCGGNTSQVTFATTQGTEYLVLVHGYNQSQGSFTLQMICLAGCSPVAENDDCADATIISISAPDGCESSIGNNYCALAPATPNPPCDPFAPIMDVWYSFNTAQGSGHTVLLESLGAATFNFALYTDCDEPTYIACYMDVTDPQLLPTLAPDSDYLLRIWNGGGNNAGQFTLCVEADLSTGFSEANTASTQLWPVPTAGILYLETSAALRGVEVLDLTGRVVLQFGINGQGVLTLDVGCLATGTYLLRNADGGAVLGRFIRE